ncbi:hypothetical protein Ancab_003872 [Ancistrocladus abbreviatus]
MMSRKPKKPAIPNSDWETVDADTMPLFLRLENDCPLIGSYDGCPVALQDILEGARLKVERFIAICWIRKKVRILNLKPQTAYLAVSYMDCYISRKYNRNMFQQMELLAAACLSWAMIVTEPMEFSLALLSDPLCSSESFEVMQMSIFETMKHKTFPITPFSYIPYFITVLCMKEPLNLFVHVSDLILASLEAINLIDYRPSIVAAAALMAVNHPNFSPEQLECAILDLADWTPQQIGVIQRCYHFMIKRLPKPKLDASSLSDEKAGSSSGTS